MKTESLRKRTGRNFAIFTVYCLCLSLEISRAADTTNQAPRSEILVDDSYEKGTIGGNPVGWGVNVYGGGAIAIVDDQFNRAAQPDSTEGKSVRFSRPAGQSGASMYWPLPPTASDATCVVITVFSMAQNSDEIFYPIVFGNWMARVGFGNEGAFIYSDNLDGRKEHIERSQLTYNPNQWYEFKAVINLVHKSYSAFVDGKAIATDMPLQKKDESWNRIMVSTGGSGAGQDSDRLHFVDDIKVTAYWTADGREPKANSSNSAAASGLYLPDHGPQEAIVHSLGNPEGPPPARGGDSDLFPLGVTASVGIFFSPEARWRWLRNSRAGGRIDALDPETRYLNLTVKPKLLGSYSISFLFPEVIRNGGGLGPFGINIGKADSKVVDLVSANPRHDPNQWIAFKTVNLDADGFMLEHPKGFSTAFSAIRFTPEDKTKPSVTYEGEDLLALLRSTNHIYDQDSPTDIAEYARGLFNDLSSLHVQVVDLQASPNLAAQKAILDEAEKYHLKLILHADDYYLPIKKAVETLAQSDPQEAEVMVRNALEPFIHEVKAHQALYGYLVADEPFVKEVPGYRVLYKVMRELDPSHPIVSYLCRASWNSDATSARGVDNMRKFADGVDQR